MKQLEQLIESKIDFKTRLSKLTSYKVGGLSLGIVTPKNVEELTLIRQYLRNHNINYKVIGNGSNVIFNDAGYKGVIIKLDEFQNLELVGREINVGAGYSLMRLSMKAALSGLTGLEFASGIPGNVGGAIYMNAGAYLSDMGYVVREVTALTPDDKVITIKNKDLDFHYRTSFFQKNPDYICLSAKIVLKYGEKDAILTVISDRKKRRALSQPLEYPSAGSVFRNPEEDSAGRIIDSLGLKGMSVGGAEVSQKHANFIINKGNATGEDIKELIRLIQKKVKDETGIELKVEQEFVD